MLNAMGFQSNVIVVSIRAEQAAEFERLFAAEELPIWEAMHRDGVLVAASLTRVEFGSHQREAVQDYAIVAVFKAMSGHTQHDRDPRFNAFLEKARTFQPSSPDVFGGTTIEAVPSGPA